MKNACFFLSFLCASMLTYAQTAFVKVDMNSIKNTVSDKNSELYYPTLLERYLAFDTTLTVDNYKLLYYGFVFQPGYSGYPALKQREINSFLKAKDFEKASLTCDTVLENFPVSLSASYQKGIALYYLDKSDSSYLKYARRYGILLATIINSGDGSSCATAFKTISLSDEYEVMYKALKIEEFRGQSLEGSCDKMSVKPSRFFQGTELFFDTSATLEYLKKISR